MSALEDLLLWRFFGAALWHLAILFTAEVTCASILSLVGAANAFGLVGLRGLLLLTLQFAVLMSHMKTMSAREPAPLFLSRLGGTWISALISRCVLRGRRLSHVTAAAYLYGSTAACGIAYVYLHPSIGLQHTTFKWSLVYGLVMAASYSTQHLAKCRDVLTFPMLQRHRYFQIKARLPQILLSALVVSLSSLLLALLTRKAVFPGLLQLLSTSLSAAMCLFGWMTGHAMLDIVFSERLRLTNKPDMGTFPSLVAVGMGSDDPLVQDLTLMDLAATSEESGAAALAARRSLVFADETGRMGWTPVGGFLIAEVREVTALLAAALPSGQAGDRPSPSKGSAAGRLGIGPAQWNVKSSPASASRQVTKDLDLAAWTLRSRYYRLGSCIRSLSALTAASLAEDRYGVLMFSDPTLSDVLVALASAVLVLQQYTKHTASLSARSSGPVVTAIKSVVDTMGCPAHPSLRKVELLSYALEDLARSCTYRLVLVFGASVSKVVREAKQKPVYGSLTEVSALVDSVLQLQE